jgi:hypothetical protein
MKVCGEKEDVVGAVMPKLDEADLQAICDILGATDRGLTGPKIGRHLKECDCPDPAPEITSGTGFMPLFLRNRTPTGVPTMSWAA